MDAYRPLALALLARLPGLDACPPGVREAWVAASAFRRHDRGEPLAGHDAPCQGLLLVVDGVLIAGRHLRTPAAHILCYVGQGGLYGAVPLVDGLMHPLDVVAHEPTLVLHIPRDRVLEDRALHEGVRRCFDLQLAEGCRVLFDRMVEHATLPLAARVEGLLHGMAQRFGVRRQGDVRIGIRLSQDNIARTVGASRQQVNAVLRAFVAQGLVSVGRESIVVHGAMARRVHHGAPTAPPPSPPAAGAAYGVCAATGP